MPRRRLLAVVTVALTMAGLTGCGGDEPEADPKPEATTSTTGSTSTTTAPSTTTTTAPSTTTTVEAGSSFGGGTTRTSVPAPSNVRGAILLTGVEVGGGGGVDRVSFTFRGGIPGYDVAYIEPPVRQDGSGDTVEVAGSAFLEIRFAPASGFDLGGTLEPTYTGPTTVVGATSVVTEVVRVGDFEANLTWAAGADRKVPFRVSTDAAAGQVVVEFDAS